MTSVRRRLAAASLVLLVPGLAACTGFDDQTSQVYQPAVGVNDRSGEVDVLGAVLVSPSDGRATFVASFVNQGDKTDKLTGVTGDGIQVQAQPVEIKSDQLVNLADRGAVSVTGEKVSLGKWVRLELQFQNGQKTEMNVPVVGHDAEFADVKIASGGSSSSPSQSPSQSPSESPSSSPSESPSSSPSASPSP